MTDLDQLCMVTTIQKACQGNVTDNQAIDALLRGGYQISDIKTNLDSVLEQARGWAPVLAVAA